MQDNTKLTHAEKVAAIKAICEQSREGKLVANYSTEKAAGFAPLLEQQKAEIAHMAATFDYSVFAGAKGPLSGTDSVPQAFHDGYQAFVDQQRGQASRREAFDRIHRYDYSGQNEFAKGFFAAEDEVEAAAKGGAQ